MSEKELNESVNELIAQSKAGKVENEAAMRVFDEAYKALPTGGSVDHYDQKLTYENGPTLKEGIHKDANGLWLNSALEITGPGSEKCPAAPDRSNVQETYECLRANFGHPISIERKTQFEGGGENEQSYAASRSIFWKNPVTDKDVWTYRNKIGDVSLHRVEDRNFQDLTVSKQFPDGKRVELSFSRPDTFHTSPVRYKGMTTFDADGKVAENRSMIRIIGRHSKYSN